MRVDLEHVLLQNISRAAANGHGRSKRADRLHGCADDKIYARTTGKNYRDVCHRFARWVRGEHPDASHDIDAAQALVPAYLLAIKNPGSRAMTANALAKGFGVGTGEAWGVEYGVRRMSQIWRGRELSSRAIAWRRNHPDVAEALRCCGLRVGCEAVEARGRDVIIGPSGFVGIRVKGKGGLIRVAPVWWIPGNTAGRDWIVLRAMECGPDGYLFRDVPGIRGINVHALRAEYGMRMYLLYAAAGVHATGELYRPRDGSEVALDKGVLAQVSAAMGHGPRRESMLWYNYLRYAEEVAT